MQIILFAALLFSCEKVAQLSDENSIVNVSIHSVSPDDVILETPLIDGNSVTIPIQYGKYLFPIRVNPIIECSDKNIKILGLDNDGSIEFANQSSIKTVNIVSSSGLTKRYEFKVNLLPSKEISEIVTFQTTQESNSHFFIAKDGFVDPTESIVSLYSINPTYPLTIKPLIGISDGAKILNWNNGDEVTFSFQGETIKLNLLSESGREEEWSIIMLSPISEFIADPEEVSIASQRLDMPFSDLSAISTSEGFIIDTLISHSKDRTLTLFYSADNVSDEIKVKVEYQLKDFLTSSGLPDNGIITYSNQNRINTFYVIDNISGVFSEWKIVLREFTTIIDIKSFHWDSYSAHSESLNLGTPVINQEKKNIIIPVISPGDFPLILSNVSINTTYDIDTNLPSNLTFNSLDEEVTFTISRNGISEIWTILLENQFKPLSDNAEILEFIVGNPSYSYTIDEVYIEPSVGEIVLIVENFQENTPLKFIPKIKVSIGSNVYGIVSGGIVEIPWGSNYEFEVISENGTLKSWKIKVIPAPQLPNADMELWHPHPQFKTIENTIFPSDGSGWNSSNNPSVVGVERTTGYRSDYGALIKTSLSTINFADIIKVTSLASGNLFLGKFNYSTLATDVYNPSSMTLFGIPYSGQYLPKKLVFVYKYKKGSKLIRTSPKTSSTTIPAFNPVEDLSGMDSGKAWIEFWSDNRDNPYASGTKIFDQDVINWKETEILISPNSGYDLGETKFVSVGFSSSSQGEYFVGADGSTLEIDQVRLIYHIPGIGSIKMK